MRRRTRESLRRWVGRRLMDAGNRLFLPNSRVGLWLWYHGFFLSRRSP